MTSAAVRAKSAAVRGSMRKSVLKRVKFTKTGKLLHRKPGQNHFNAKHSRRAQLRQKGMKGFDPTTTKNIKRYL